MAGLKDPATIAICPEIGVGKTELAKDYFNPMSMKLVRYDMAEYQERHTDVNLLDPGYVGFADGKAGDGLLITQEDNQIVYCY